MLIIEVCDIVLISDRVELRPSATQFNVSDDKPKTVTLQRTIEVCDIVLISDRLGSVSLINMRAAMRINEGGSEVLTLIPVRPWCYRSKDRSGVAARPLP